jgi:hypothetical protein
MLSDIALVLSMIGYLFVAKKEIFGLYIWLPANLLWVIHFLNNSDLKALMLFVFYLLTTIWGIYNWRKNGVGPGDEK